MDYKDYSRREILDKAEYYRSIGKTSHQKKLEDYVKAMDYGTDGFGVPYKKCSDSELKKLMEADPEPDYAEVIPSLLQSTTTTVISDGGQMIPFPVPVGVDGGSADAYAVWGRKVVGN